ncbi:DUF4145 domain-containing protein [Candidatus Sumerlaeota bacterium]|nr:DUF4145 domain-containing protein [Candidatus Sumerlaeota bacterium]
MSEPLSLPDRILKLLQIFRVVYDFDNKSFNLKEDQASEFGTLWRSIVNDLIWSPGTLIYIPDETERKSAKRLIDLIWEIQDAEEIFDQMASGGYSGLMVSIVGDYIDRAKMLKPTVISIHAQNSEFKAYFEEAMMAWLHGLNSSSLILCGSIIEDMIKTQLYNIDPKLLVNLANKGHREKNKELFKLIETAFSHHIIDKEGKETAHLIRKLRNDAVHKLKKVSEEETYRAILDTKELIEKILTIP